MNAGPRKICVVTGTRAEYGLLFWLMKAVQNDPGLELQLIVTGTHLEPRFGNTVDVIEQDGFRINARVPINLNNDTPTGIVKSMTMAANGIAEALAGLDPAITVLLGDRYEIFGAAQAAMISRHIIAHLYGGEITEGAIDESIRHAITKMSHLHFTSSEVYRQRIMQLGEDPERVFNVGAIGLDNIEQLELMSLDALSRDIGIDLSGGYFLVTYHPLTLSHAAPAEAASALVDALNAFPSYKVILTGVNADPGNASIRRVFDVYADTHADRVRTITSMGQTRYLSAMKHCASVIGNSSSGLVEAPSFGVPTVNIGNRQKGRLQATSVIDCAESAHAISAALHTALSEQHRQISKQTVSPFGTSGVSSRIQKILRDAPLDGILVKRFVDMMPENASPPPATSF